ncbi:hypothetical protein PFISCL1PPCAC_26315, partial [Pristionchus fissidentatus]
NTINATKGYRYFGNSYAVNENDHFSNLIDLPRQKVFQFMTIADRRKMERVSQTMYTVAQAVNDRVEEKKPSFELNLIGNVDGYTIEFVPLDGSSQKAHYYKYDHVYNKEIRLTLDAGASNDFDRTFEPGRN